MTTIRRHVRLSFAFALIAVALLAVVSTGVVLAARSDKWWWDNLGGPSSSHYVTLDQINKATVKNLQVAWFYPYGNTGFNLSGGPVAWAVGGQYREVHRGYQIMIAKLCA